MHPFFTAVFQVTLTELTLPAWQAEFSNPVDPSSTGAADWISNFVSIFKTTKLYKLFDCIFF